VGGDPHSADRYGKRAGLTGALKLGSSLSREPVGVSSAIRAAVLIKSSRPTQDFTLGKALTARRQIAIPIGTRGPHPHTIKNIRTFGEATGVERA